ncbi:spoIIIAH [Firmicutes bacterium CAG:460]|uniref:SpoIIIAH-like family protein n=1 Tax=Candidatus Onthocola sp. TaxID=3085646 RepID=UPI00033CB543|nr:SpoIIIAH-like family protein [Bacillota bacterium]CDE50529.1 spoIIIAH [Firmicutes bacterium CAG:460]
MINKQNLWFVTLFSLILVLGIYYVTMGDETLSVLAGENNVSSPVEVKASDVIVALQVASDESVLKEMNEYQSILLDDTATIEEKNDAYNALQALSNSKSECEKIKKMITEKFKYDSFIKIDGDAISITIASKEHSKEIANKIIREVQNMYDKQKYITVKFE